MAFEKASFISYFRGEGNWGCGCEQSAKWGGGSETTGRQRMDREVVDLWWLIGELVSKNRYDFRSSERLR